MVAHSNNPSLRSLRQNDCEFQANLGYVRNPCLKKKKERKKETTNGLLPELCITDSQSSLLATVGP
jgi:hypothetical protein